MVLSPAACPLQAVNTIMKSGFVHPQCSRLRLFLCCPDTGAQLQDKRMMSQTESGHLGDLLASSHMADFLDESRSQERQAKTAMSTRCSGRGGGVEDTTPNVCHTPFLTPLIICSICCWHCTSTHDPGDNIAAPFLNQEMDDERIRDVLASPLYLQERSMCRPTTSFSL